MEYYTAIKNEVMPFAAIWMDIEIIILSSQKEEDKYDITYMCKIKYDTSAFIYKTETDS